MKISVCGKGGSGRNQRRFGRDTGASGGVSMCLAKAYLSKSSDEPVLQDIAHMRMRDDYVELETLFGEEKVIPGRVVEIDFATSKILLDQHHETGKAQ